MAAKAGDPIFLGGVRHKPSSVFLRRNSPPFSTPDNAALPFGSSAESDVKFAVWSADALMKMIFMRDATRSVTEFTMVMPNGTERVVRRVP